VGEHRFFRCVSVALNLLSNPYEGKSMKAAAFIVVSLLVGYGAYGLAQSRVDVRPSLTPIASSSSNGMSFAWFYDASSRTVYACVVTAPQMDCKISAVLP
jgi:hypothetical protein